MLQTSRCRRLPEKIGASSRPPKKWVDPRAQGPLPGEFFISARHQAVCVSMASRYSRIRKVHDYFKAGVTRVWVVYPEQAEVYIYSTPQQVQVVGVGQELDGGDLLPGFRLPVAVLFEDEP